MNVPQTGVDVRPVSGALGAEVHNLDLECVDQTGVGVIRELLDEHLVLFFPDQHLSVAGQRRFAAALGDLVVNSYTPLADPDVDGVTVHRSEEGYVADVWHSDGQPRPAPVKYTIFKMIQSPTRGGDTMWTNQHLVFERLSAPMQDLLGGLTARQRSLVNPSEETDHPAVIVHPQTGRRLLYVSKAHTVRFLELTLGESQALISYLADLAIQPEYTCRRRWDVGTVGIWDNLATTHYGVNDFDEPRVFHRAMVQGPRTAGHANKWPESTDGRPRTMVRNDGTAGVVGQMTEKLWTADR